METLSWAPGPPRGIPGDAGTPGEGGGMSGGPRTPGGPDRIMNPI